MPKPVPLDPDLRRRIGDDIAMHVAGRNELARRYGVSPGVVSKIARERGLYFENDWQTTTATECRRVDQELRRLEREEELETELLELRPAFRLRDGRETKARRRLSYALYDVNRHHN
jgi:hypothetical protein